MNQYSIYALDKDDFELSTDDDYTNLKTAIKRAKEYLQDDELINTGLIKVEVRNQDNEVEWDYFVV